MSLNSQPLIGFRRWKVTTTGVLTAVAMQSPWNKGENLAVCKQIPASDHDSPGAGCFCGFNAWFDYDEANREYDSPGTVLGVIAGAGNMRIHEVGFRSEKAQVLALYHVPDHQNYWMLQAIETASEKYEVPVFDDLQSMIQFSKNYGIYVPDHQPAPDREEDWERSIWPVDSENDQPSIVYNDGTQKWYQNGELHRDGDRPALIDSDGTKEWWRNGKPFRENGEPNVMNLKPRLPFIKPFVSWKNDRGEVHREGDLPASILYNEYGNVTCQTWMLNGVITRSGDRPARINSLGKYWFDSDGQLHRNNGLPAVELYDGTREWWKDGKQHRDNDLPAIEHPDGGKEWIINGVYHRDDAPAVIRSDGYQGWYQHGNPHRDEDLPAVVIPGRLQEWWAKGLTHREDDKPAVIHSDGSEEWYRKGKRHREGDLPAVVKSDGGKEWWLNGSLHRQSGPAVIRPDGYKEFWIHGKKIDRKF